MRKIKQKIKQNKKWGRGDSNPHAFRHMILSHARLPVPALPHEPDLASAIITETVNHENSIYCPKVHKTRGYL